MFFSCLFEVQSVFFSQQTSKKQRADLSLSKQMKPKLDDAVVMCVIV